MKLKVKLSKNSMIRRVFKILFSKSFISSLIFASALWAYTSLNEEYRTNINIPLHINLPSTRAFETTPPDNLTLTIKGSGWQIFNLYFNASAMCNIDLSNTIIKDTLFDITRDNILKGIQFLNFVQPLEIIPDRIKISTGIVGEYCVPISPLVYITPKEGYTVVGGIQIKPDIVFIKGNDAIAKKIKKWTTETKYFENVFEPISTTIMLSDSLKGVINLKSNTVKIFADVQQVAEMVIPDVRVKIRGENLMRNHIVEPLLITVTVKGGIKAINELSQESISAYIEYQKIIGDSSGVLVPVIKTPENISVLSVSPPYLYHKIRVK